MAIPSPLEKSLDVPAYPIWRLSVAQYHAMIGAGILTDDDPVELLEGWLVAKMPKNPRHTLATQQARDVLSPILLAGYFINVQEPLTTEDSEPEPDLSVIRGQRRDYLDHHPLPGEVALVVEVADAILQRDRTLKLRIYARARVPVYWILNLQEGVLEVYSAPEGSGGQAAYGQRRDYRPGEAAPLVIDGQEVGQVAVHALLG